MRHFVENQSTDSEYEQWFSRQVQIGIEAADAGEVIPAEEVEAEFASLRACAFFPSTTSKS
jgi:predicted transcriptional regulator